MRVPEEGRNLETTTSILLHACVRCSTLLCLLYEGAFFLLIVFIHYLYILRRCLAFIHRYSFCPLSLFLTRHTHPVALGGLDRPPPWRTTGSRRSTSHRRIWMHRGARNRHLLQTREAVYENPLPAVQVTRGLPLHSIAYRQRARSRVFRSSRGGIICKVVPAQARRAR